jgi:MFS family permease
MQPRSVTRLSSAANVPDSRAAWFMVAAAFIAGFVVFGVMYSFGAFFQPMAAEFHADRAQTSAFFSIAGLIFYMSGSLTGYLSDLFGPRVVVGMGAVVMGASLMLTATIGHLWVGYLSYGVGVGIGAACAYIPTLAIVGGWFDRHRNSALGIAAAGTGCGTLILPPVAATLIQAYGWRVAYLAFGLGCFMFLAICALIATPPPVARTRATRSVGRIVLSFEFMVLYASWLCATTALLVPLVFLPAFARGQGVGPVAASALLSVLGGMGVLGRVGIGSLTKRIGTLRLFKLSVLMMGTSYGLWLVFADYRLLLAFAALLGLGYGLRISLMPVVLIEFFGLGNLGAILGIFFTASGISALCGPILAGLIIDYTGSYQWAIVFALAMGALGFAVIAPLRPHRASQDDGNPREAK